MAEICTRRYTVPDCEGEGAVSTHGPGRRYEGGSSGGTDGHGPLHWPRQPSGCEHRRMKGREAAQMSLIGQQPGWQGSGNAGRDGGGDLSRTG